MGQKVPYKFLYNSNRLLQACSHLSHIKFLTERALSLFPQKILEAANRWTDNIFMIKSWCKRKFDKDDREMNKAFDIPDDLDYVDT